MDDHSHKMIGTCSLKWHHAVQIILFYDSSEHVVQLSEEAGGREHFMPQLHLSLCLSSWGITVAHSGCRTISEHSMMSVFGAHAVVMGPSIRH